MPVKIELFNSFNSFTKIFNPSLVQGNYTMQPLTGGNANAGNIKLITISAAGGAGAIGVRAGRFSGGSGYGFGGLITVNAGGQLTSVTIVNRGNGYKAGDVLDVTDNTGLTGAQITVQAIFDNGGTSSFNPSGDLEIKGGVNDQTVTVKCLDTSYRSLIEETAFAPLQINRLRMTTATDQQIDNALQIVRTARNGTKESIIISPRTFFNPSQFQSRIIDIPTNIIIDGYTALYYTVNDNENIKLNLSSNTGEILNINLLSQ